MIYYEKRTLGRWSPRTTNLNSPTPGPDVRNIQTVDLEHVGLDLQSISAIYGTKPDEQSVVVREVKVPDGQTPLDEKLRHPLLDVYREGYTARDSGLASNYHGHSLEHCIHAAGWVERDLRIALDTARQREAAMKLALAERLVPGQYWCDVCLVVAWGGDHTHAPTPPLEGSNG